MFDLDKSGKISKDELKQVLGRHKEFRSKDDAFWDQMVKDCDKNGDGEVLYIS